MEKRHLYRHLPFAGSGIVVVFCQHADRSPCGKKAPRPRSNWSPVASKRTPSAPAAPQTAHCTPWRVSCVRRVSVALHAPNGGQCPPYGNANLKPLTIRRDRPRLRRCLPLAVLLVSITALACGRAPAQRADMPSNALIWRRTRDGWEQPHWLNPSLPPRPAPFHPLCLAALEALLAAMALVARASAPRFTHQVADLGHDELLHGQPHRRRRTGHRQHDCLPH